MAQNSLVLRERVLWLKIFSPPLTDLYLIERCSVGSGGVRARVLGLDDGQVIAAAEARLEEETRPAAAQLTVRDDRDAVPEDVSLVHEVRR